MEELDCSKHCMGCDDYQCYKVNLSELHGLCASCASKLTSCEYDCRHCSLNIEVLQLKEIQPLKVCVSCKRCSRNKCLDGKHYFCKDCQVNKRNCPICRGSDHELPAPILQTNTSNSYRLVRSLLSQPDNQPGDILESQDDKSMVNCSVCGKIAQWFCKIHNIGACNDHRLLHIEEPDDHHVIKIKNQLTVEKKSQLITNLTEKIAVLKHCQDSIIAETHRIISHVLTISMESIKNLNSQIIELRKSLENIENNVRLQKDAININTIFKFAVPSLGLEFLDAYFRSSFVFEESKLNCISTDEAIKKLAEDYQIFIQGHTQTISCIAITRNDEYIVTGSHDKTVRLWSILQGSQIAVLEGHSDVITCVAVTNDSKYALSGSSDKTIRVWNLNNKGLDAILDSDSRGITCIAVSSDDTHVGAGSDDNTIILWKLKDKQKSIIKCEATPSFIAFDNYLTNICFIASKRFCIWNIKQQKMNEPVEKVMCMALSSDQRYAFLGHYEQNVMIYNLQTNDIERKIPCHNVNKVISMGDNSFLAINIEHELIKFDLSNNRITIILKRFSSDFQYTLSSFDRFLIFSNSAP